MKQVTEIDGFPKYTIDTDGVVTGPNGPIKPYNYNKGKHVRQTINIVNEEGCSITLSMARLVAEHFIINRNGYRYVLHKDGNRFNNNVNNLEWNHANR